MTMRTYPLITAAASADRCDGCAVAIPAGTRAVFRNDGALFCSPACAAIHDGIPLDTNVTPIRIPIPEVTP